MIAALPVALAMLPYGMVVGYASSQVGLGLAEVIGFSAIFYAGAAQLAALELLDAGAPLWVILITVIAINARLIMYSASMSQHLWTEPRAHRTAAAFVLSDHAYAVSITGILRGDKEIRPLWHFLGAAIPLWLGWQVWTVSGALAGGLVADLPHLEFAIPLAFLALLATAVTDKPTVAAATVAGALALVLVNAPANAGMPVAALSGVLAGYAVGKRGQQWA